MSIYALIPLFVTIAYVPLLVTSLTGRPWTSQQKLFVVFLLLAMLWSFSDYVFRGDFAPGYRTFLLQCTVFFFTLMAVQYHVFASTFYAPGQSRWLTVAYVALGIGVFGTFFGGAIQGVNTDGPVVYPVFGPGMALIIIPLLVLAARNAYVFWPKLGNLDNPVLHNQIVSLLLGLAALLLFTPLVLLPWGKEIPINHAGNLLNAIFLSYAVMRNKAADVRTMLGQSLALLSLVLIGLTSYFALLVVLHFFFNYNFDIKEMAVAAAVSIVAAGVIYQLRGFLFITLGRVFHGQTYDNRLRLAGFAGKIHNVFSLHEQGAELLNLVNRGLNCRRSCLLFPGADTDSFSTQIIEPAFNAHIMDAFTLPEASPLLQYLRRTHKSLTAKDITVLPEFESLLPIEREAIRSRDIEAFVPLISRDRLIGILALGGKYSGRYSLEDFELLDDVSNRVAVSIEKEYLREQLREREEELAVINRSSAIITSSLNIETIFDNFIEELKKIVAVDWAAISLVEGEEMYLLASSSGITAQMSVGQRVPIRGTATEQVVKQGQTVIEGDLTRESRFTTGPAHLEQGIRSMAFVPLIVKGAVIGSMSISSAHPNAYNPRQIKLLEQLASQIAMPIQNSLLYATAEKKARVDELTGLLNRRSLDETIASEISRHTRYGGIFSLIILDLDSLKRVNDTYGHLTGDRLLRQLAVVLKTSIRTADQAFRYGGDEFAILLPETPLEAAVQVAERILTQAPLSTKIDSTPITVSLGVATWPLDGASLTEIFAAADGALYEAKRRGGNQCIRTSDNATRTPHNAAADNRRKNEEITNSIYTLAATVDARQSHTGSHAKSVNHYALALGEALKLTSQEMRRLSTCAILHDVGKVGISDNILGKTDALDEQERNAIKGHSQLGATIVGHAAGLTPCVPGILYHHECYDGSGYPAGLQGDAIPIEARILAIADAFVVMTAERTSGEPQFSMEQALHELEQCAGKQFDPALVQAFVDTTRKKMTSAPTGIGSPSGL